MMMASQRTRAYYYPNSCCRTLVYLPQTHAQLNARITPHPLSLSLTPFLNALRGAAHGTPEWTQIARGGVVTMAMVFQLVVVVVVAVVVLVVVAVVVIVVADYYNKRIDVVVVDVVVVLLVVLARE